MSSVESSKMIRPSKIQTAFLVQRHQSHRASAHVSTRHWTNVEILYSIFVNNTITPAMCLPPGTRIGDEFRVEGFMRRTSRSELFHGFVNQTRARCVVRVSLPSVTDEELRSELDILHALTGFQNVMQCKGPFNVRGYRIVVTRHYDMGNLTEYMNLSRWDVETCRVIFRRLLEGLRGMHTAGWVHRAICMHNIWLSKNQELVPEVFIAGIEHACLERDATGCVFPNEYMSPEGCKNEDCGKPADMWAVGVLIYRVLTGREPFPLDDSFLDMVINGTYDSGWPAECGLGDDFRDLIKGLLEVDPRVRLTVEKALEHRWICGNDDDDDDTESVLDMI